PAQYGEQRGQFVDGGLLHGSWRHLCDYTVRRVRACFADYVDRRRQQAEGAFQGAEGAQDGGDLGRNGQLEAGSQAEQVGEHLGGGGPAREVARHEPAERPLQLLLVDVVRARDQFQQRVAERGRVAAADRRQQVQQRGSLLDVQAADRAEIKQGEAPDREEQDVARMPVGVEQALI